ncbi:hypothetical protein DRW03_08765 [Corallococcus sp. H22C18031201]|nr:hypothetical protein DRW03_08765 [Corallococcus sp. H22C18031201]
MRREANASRGERTRESPYGAKVFWQEPYKTELVARVRDAGGQVVTLEDTSVRVPVGERAWGRERAWDVRISRRVGGGR